MEDSRTQRPYRYGMILLCLGALINWLGISEPTPNAEPIRYLGVACILGKFTAFLKIFDQKLNFDSFTGGALLIMTAMCCWLKAPNRTSDANEEVITTFPYFVSPFRRTASPKSPLLSHYGAFNVPTIIASGERKQEKSF